MQYHLLRYSDMWVMRILSHAGSDNGFIVRQVSLPIVRPIVPLEISIHLSRILYSLQHNQVSSIYCRTPSYCSSPSYCPKMATRSLRSKRRRLSSIQIVKDSIQRILTAIGNLVSPTRSPALLPSPISVVQKALELPAAMVQPKTTPFKAYDLRRKKLHTIEGSGGKAAPRKTTIHRIARSDWAAPKVVKGLGKRGAKATKKKAVGAGSLTAASLLRCDDAEICCQHCGRFGDDPECGTRCYTAFRKAADADKLIVSHSIPERYRLLRHLGQEPEPSHPSPSITETLLTTPPEIKGPGKHGYSAYTKPGCTLTKGQWLGEYVGQLRPLALQTDSLYRFEIPGVCAIDAEPCGNWTRFVNSSCAPNVSAWTDTVGKRHTVFFQAMRDIGPEEELTFQYGKQYFRAAGLLCECGVVKRGHLPGEAKGKGKGVGKK